MKKMYIFLIITAALTMNACSHDEHDILFDSIPHLRTMDSNPSWHINNWKDYFQIVADIQPPEVKLDGSTKITVKEIDMNNDKKSITISRDQLNPAIAEPDSIADFDQLPEGVTQNPIDILKKPSTSYVLLIAPCQPWHISVKYVVRTRDWHLDRGYTQCEELINQNITANQLYHISKQQLIIHLKFNAIIFQSVVESII